MLMWLLERIRAAEMWTSGSCDLQSAFLFIALDGIQQRAEVVWPVEEEAREESEHKVLVGRRSLNQKGPEHSLQGDHLLRLY